MTLGVPYWWSIQRRWGYERKGRIYEVKGIGDLKCPPGLVPRVRSACTRVSVCACISYGVRVMLAVLYHRNGLIVKAE